jgi:hypothetical protein
MTKLAALVALASTAHLANGECANACSGHGNCGSFDQCSCFRNWQGNNCAERTCPFGHAHVDSPKGDLNMDGGALSGPSVPVIFNSEVYPQGTTEQYPDAQADEAHFYMECANKGLCDRKTGMCECFDGYDGSACQRASCPGGHGGDSEQCSGHGTCHSLSYMAEHLSEANLALAYNEKSSYGLWDASYTRGCVCDPGFSGADCSHRDCKYGVDPLFSSTGTALVTTALVVNSCMVGPAGPFGSPNSGDGTTNGLAHKYDDITITQTGAESANVGIAVAAIAAGLTGTQTLSVFPSAGYRTYDVQVKLNGLQEIPVWAVAGADIIFMNSGDTGKIGCKYRVVQAVGVLDTPSDPTATGDSYVILHLDHEGKFSPNENMNSAKCESNGQVSSSSTYDLYFVANTFTLLFTDHEGKVYRTVPISAAVADYSNEVTEALKALPNRVIESVQVNPMMISPRLLDESFELLSSNDATEMAYEIEFKSNPGQLGDLRVDSTPIRNGKSLQSGIECQWDSAAQNNVDSVYSAVGYKEVGEDATEYSEYAGNIAFFSELHLDSSTGLTLTGGDGEENKFVYTQQDLTGKIEPYDVVKIGSHLYVVEALTSHYLKLNTYFVGNDVMGVSTEILPTDGSGDSIQIEYTDANTITLKDFAYATSSYTSDGTEVFAEWPFPSSGIIRVVTTASSEFDCLFHYDGVVGSATATTGVFDYAFTADLEACKSLQTDADGSPIDVKVFTWEDSLENGALGDFTRIFTSPNGNSADQQGVINAKVGGHTMLVGGSNTLAIGDQVLYGTELNVVTGNKGEAELTALGGPAGYSAVTLKNPFAGGGRIGFDRFNSEAVYSSWINYGTTSELLYKYTPSGDEDDAKYTYVSQCSSRGICDESSGECKCFAGYAGDSCNAISRLFA